MLQYDIGAMICVIIPSQSDRDTAEDDLGSCEMTEHQEGQSNQDTLMAY
jgi:hypothetical protein